MRSTSTATNAPPSARPIAICSRRSRRSWGCGSPRARRIPMTHTIVLIPGDGIGPEVSEAVLRIIKVAGVAIDWEPHDAGVLALERHGTTLPDRAARRDQTDESRAEGSGDDADRRGLHERQRGPAQGAGPLRQRASGVVDRRASLSATPTSIWSSSARTPRTSTPGSSTKSCPGVVESLKIISQAASNRIARFAFDYARRNRARRSRPCTRRTS